MKSRAAHLLEIKQIAERLELANRLACIEFARALRLNDEQKLICRELGRPEKDLIPVAYYECVYRLLCFGTRENRFLLLTGSREEIEPLVAQVQRNNGFYDECGHWCDV